MIVAVLAFAEHAPAEVYAYRKVYQGYDDGRKANVSIKSALFFDSYEDLSEHEPRNRYNKPCQQDKDKNMKGR